MKGKCMKLEKHRESSLGPKIFTLLVGLVIVIVTLIVSVSSIEHLPGMLIFGGFGLFFVIIVIVDFAGQIKHRMTIKNIRTKGVCCKANIIGTEAHPVFHTNNVHPITVICEFRDIISGDSRTVRSDFYYNKLEPYVGKEVDLYIDRFNSDNYYVDIETLVATSPVTPQETGVYDFRK